MSATVEYFKGTNPNIRIKLDEANLIAQGITTFTLVGSTIVTEFESEEGDFLKFDNSKVTIVSALVYDITPTAADVTALQLGKHIVSGQVTVNGGGIFGFKIKNQFVMDRLIQT